MPAGYGRLRGAVGLQDWRLRGGNGARFTISQGGVDLWTGDERKSYDRAQPFGPLDVAPGAVTLTSSSLGEYSCDTASWLDLERSPR